MPLSGLEAGVPGVSRLGLCMAGVELLALFDWKTSASLGPVYCTFASLSSEKAAGNYQRPSGSYLGCSIIWFSSGSFFMPSSQREAPGAYRQSFSLIDQDTLWSISRAGPHVARGKKCWTLSTRRSHLSQGLNTIDFRSTIGNARAKKTNKKNNDGKEFFRDNFLKMPRVSCQSPAFWIIRHRREADLLTKIITFGIRALKWSTMQFH